MTIHNKLDKVSIATNGGEWALSNADLPSDSRIKVKRMEQSGQSKVYLPPSYAPPFDPTGMYLTTEGRGEVADTERYIDKSRIVSHRGTKMLKLTCGDREAPAASWAAGD